MITAIQSSELILSIINECQSGLNEWEIHSALQFDLDLGSNKEVLRRKKTEIPVIVFCIKSPLASR